MQENGSIHADYSGRASVLVQKQPSGFVFRNPGLMRVPAEAALNGGESDCRNRTLHQMFLLINLGERAGSGVPKIRAGWAAAGHELKLSDSFEPFEQTRLEMLWGQTLPESDGVSDGRKTVETTVLALLRAEPNLTIPLLAEKTGKSHSTIERQLRKLREQGVIQRIGSDKTGQWKIIE